LKRFSDFLARLSSLPERVGPIDLGRLRDTDLPLPENWPVEGSSASGTSVPGSRSQVPGSPCAAWLASELRSSGESPVAALLAVASKVGGLPEWTLTAMWLLESALAWPGDIAKEHGKVLAELGHLYCQTGDFVQGVQQLDDARDLLPLDDPGHWRCAYRAARWISQLNPAAATDRLHRLEDDPAAPPGIRMLAELEILGQQRESTHDTYALIDRARATGDLVKRACDTGLDEVDLHGLRTRANQLSGRWLGASRIRSLRAQGRDHLLEALHECSSANDYRNLSHVLDALGRAHLRLGSFRHARDAFEESIALKQKQRDLWGLGGSLTGLAECLLAAGQARESLPYFQVNLLLLETLGGMQVLFVRNLARHLNALVAAGCDPMENTPASPDLLELARELLQRCAALVAKPINDPYYLLLASGYERLAARNAASPEERQRHVEQGVHQARDARTMFARQGNWLRVSEANRTLAALLLDQAARGDQPGRSAGEGRIPQSGQNEKDALALARQALEEAEKHHQGEQGRVQAELSWARYHQLAGAPYQMQLHLAAARRAAEASGYEALALGVDARLGVQLTGPTGPAAPARLTPLSDEADEVAVIVQPGETVGLEVRASDWRDRPLPAYVLHGVIEQEGPISASFTPDRIRTDHLGRARFEVHAHQAGRAVFRAATPDGVHALSLRIVSRPVAIEWAADLADGRAGEDDRLLRQLFGPSCPRLHVTRAFAGGHSGTRVLLVEPFRDGEHGAEMRGQPCIVKLGPRGLLEDERSRYLRWVKELMPANVSRLDGFTVWNDRAALRMSLVGDISRGQVREAREWLVHANAFDAHLLLERVFVGDLAACWYGNSSRLREPQRVEDLYGPMIPSLLHLVDTIPSRGFATPTGQPTVRLTEGLRHPGSRSFHVGDEISLADASLLGCRQTPGGWEYELKVADGQLRFTFRTPLAPELLEPEGDPARVTPRAVRGRVESTAHDRLVAALRHCCNVFSRTHPGEIVTLTADERFLLVQSEEMCRRLPNPLDHLARLAAMELPCAWSLIHGDLHGRNILVGPQGQPFYIDFARTGYGPTLFDFIKFEVYLWHEGFAGWPQGEPPAECSLAQAMHLLEEFCSADPARHFPSPYARRELAKSGAGGPSNWTALFRQCLATLRSAARPHVVDPLARDYFVPLALYTALMLRWCEPEEAAGDEERSRRLARQGVVHAVAAGAMLAGVVGNG
jgi:tetratricopeptide (TPR) repeat protein